MKKFFLIIILLLMTSCLTTNCPICPPCPPENAYSFDTFPFGSFPVETPKGFYDDKDNWVNEDEWNKIKDMPIGGGWKDVEMVGPWL